MNVFVYHAIRTTSKQAKTEGCFYGPGHAAVNPVDAPETDLVALKDDWPVSMGCKKTKLDVIVHATTKVEADRKMKAVFRPAGYGFKPSPDQHRPWSYSR